jgi:long-chain fatty acid transport protein
LGLIGATTAHASPVDLFGFGARGGAMGGAVAAMPRGHEAVYYNPAALAFEERLSFALGFQRADFFLDINGQPTDTQEAPALTLGFGVPLPLKGWLERRLSLGLGFVLPQTAIIEADIPRPGAPGFTLLESRAQVVSVQGAFSVRCTDWLSLGIGTLGLAELRGDISVAPNEENSLGARVRDEVVTDFSLTAGVLLKPTEWISGAVTLREQSRADFTLPVQANLGEKFPLPVPTLDITGVAQFDPRQVAVELAFAPTANLKLGAGVTWKQWSDFSNPIVYTAVPDDYPAQPTPNFSDTWVPRVGAEWGLPLSSDLTVTPRAGFIYEPSPAPEQTGLQNYLDNDRLITTAGVGLTYDRVGLDLVGQWHALTERTSRKRPQGEDGQDLSSNPGYPTIRHGGDALFWGVELRLEL